MSNFITKKIKEITAGSGFLRYFKNTTWVLGEKVLQILASLIVGVWVARYLGPENLGILSYAQSFVAIFLAFSTLGLNNILVRELVKEPEAHERLLGSTFILQTFGSLVLMACLYIGINLTSNDKFVNSIILILGTATFFQSFHVIIKFFESIVKSKKVVIVNIISLSLSSLVKIYFILSQAPLIYFVYLILFDAFFIASGLVLLYSFENYKIRNWRFSNTTAINLLKDSWPLILSGIVVSIYMKIDQVMIKEIMDSESVGHYAAAVRLSEAWYFIPTVICSSLFPAVVNAKLRSEKLYYSRLQNLYDLMVWISVSIAIPMTFLSSFLVELLYGEAFEPAGRVLKIHIWAGVFVFLGVSRGGWILNENLQRFTSLYLGAGMIINIIANFILIPYIGIDGAAYATLLSQAVSVLFAPLLFRPTRLSFFMMSKSLLFINSLRKIKSLLK